MIKVLKNYFTLSRILILLVLFALTPIATYGIDNMVGLFISSNYITTVLNVAYIIYAYSRTCLMEGISTNIIQRVKIEKYYKLNVQLSILSLLVFCTLLYGSALMFFEVPRGYESLIITFIILNTIVYIIEEVIILMQIGCKRNILYIILPLMINFVFRYAIIVPWADKFFN
ncbi:hypothetical protein [Amedibacillus sp. YH-ame10]